MIKQISEEIIKFSQFLCKRKLYNYQIPFAKRIIGSLLKQDGEDITALFSRQSGKTETVSVVTLGISVILPKLVEIYPDILPPKFKEGVWIGFFAPTNEQVDTLFSRCRGFLAQEETKQILKDRSLSLSFKESKKLITFSNRSLIRVSSADKNANIESKTYHLIVCDEAQDIAERKMRKSIEPMMAATNGTMIRLGTPNGQECDFKSAIDRNKERDNKRKDKFDYNHFEYDYIICQKENVNYKKFIDKMIEKYGINDPYFKMSFGLEWFKEIGHFLTPEVFEIIKDKNKYPVSEYRGLDSLVVGIDFAKSPASTVVTVLQLDQDVKRILGWLELQGEDYKEQFKLIVDYLQPFKNIERIALDATGVGAAASEAYVDYFMNVDIYVDCCFFTDKFKSDIYKYLYQEIVGGKILVPSAGYNLSEYKKFKHQFIDLKKEWRKGLMLVHHPNKTGAHDDYCDSLALANWSAKYYYDSNIDNKDYDILSINKTRRF